MTALRVSSRNALGTWRRLFAAVMAGFLVTAGITACAGTVPDDCATISQGDVRTAGCRAAGALRVLAVLDAGENCVDVPAVSDTARGDGRLYCLGAVDADPAKAINVARAGDCAKPTPAPSSLQRVPCSDPAAQYQILRRFDGVPDLGLEGSDEALSPGNNCASVPGTRAQYTWKLKKLDFPLANEVRLFCLAPADIDPATVLETAQVGDCLRQTGAQPDWTKIDCTDPRATHRLLNRTQAEQYLVGSPCQDTPGTRPSRRA